MNSLKLNNNKIIEEYGVPYIIAELNSSHFGDLDIAKQMIKSAKSSGADCVKFQSWSSTSLYSNSYYRANPIAKRFVNKFSLSETEILELCEYCKEISIDFASTPYAESEVTFLLDKCNVPFIKIASMEINNHEFLKFIASKKTAIILSTGMSTFEEVIQATEVIKSTGNTNLAILHCVSIYPLTANLANLKNITELRRIIDNVPIGYSDHTLGYEVPVASIALGCPIIEKHFTLDNKKIGMDNQMATMPDQFKQMVNACHTAQSAMGSPNRVLSAEEKAQRDMMRRSIVSKNFIPINKIITINDLDFKRPGNGMPPTEVTALVGKKSRRDIEADELLEKSDFF